MSNLETLHGDEEAIEACPDRWYEVLGEYVSPDTGELDLTCAHAIVERTQQELIVQGNAESDVRQAFTYALQVIKDKNNITQYL